MASRLLAAGFGLRVFNRTAARADPLTARGAQRCASPAEAARGASVAITMLSDDGVLRDVTLGPDGLAAALPSGAVHLSMSTVSPEVNRQLAAEHRRAGTDLVAAPVLGRPDAVEAGRLWVLAAGPARLEAACRPVFEALGQGHQWLGEDPGQANVLKIALNFMLASAIEMVSEAFTVVEKQGVDRRQLLELMRRLLPSPALEGYAQRMLAGQFLPAGFSSTLALKDVDLALGLAEAGRSPAPFASVIHDRLLTALARGRGEWDLAGLVQVARDEAGLG
jgi:3-hydroxyisobutyrate dehydrogenase-like beta-hydroxyacid dehydrogenase